MKLRTLKEASPLVRFPVSQELFNRALKDRRSRGRKITQEDVGKFAAWLDVEIHGLGKRDLKRLVWEGIKGLKDDPDGVEKVFSDFIKEYIEGYLDPEDDPEEFREDAVEEMLDDFFRFLSGRQTR